MGEFLLTCGGPGAAVQRVPNHLMWRGQDRVLRRILPEFGAAPTFLQGFSGPQFHAPSERPNWDLNTFAFDRRGSLGSVNSYATANEGGAPADSIRLLTGYARQAITWTVSRDGHGVIIDGAWKASSNRVTWERHGDWSPYYGPGDPGNWDPDVKGPYAQPWPCEDGYPWEVNHGFPWCAARVHADWPLSGDRYHDGDFTEAEWHNPWGVNCTDWSGGTLWPLSGYPVGAAFITIAMSGFAEELFAAGILAKPAWWRMGGYLAGRYRGRFGGPNVSADFAYYLARWLLLGEAMPWSSWKVVCLSTAAAGISPVTTYAGVALAFPELAAADTWTVQAYAVGPPEVLPRGELDPLPDAWTNASGAAVTVRTIAVVGWNGSAGRYELLFWKGLDPEVSVPAGDTFRLTGLTFSLQELADG